VSRRSRWRRHPSLDRLDPKASPARLGNPGQQASPARLDLLDRPGRLATRGLPVRLGPPDRMAGTAWTAPMVSTGGTASLDRLARRDPLGRKGLRDRLGRTARTVPSGLPGLRPPSFRGLTRSYRA
jgi:hypothetical protein